MANEETFRQVARKYALLTGLNERASLADWEAALRKLCVDREEAIQAGMPLELRQKAELQLDQTRNAWRLVAQKILLEKFEQLINEKSRRAYERLLAKTENQALLPTPGETAHEDWLRLRDLAETAFPATAGPMPHSVGAGRFTLLNVLGRGGMGEVWLARDERLAEQVALKFLPPEIQGDAVALDDLRRETSRSHGLAHPNIVRIHDLHEDADGRAFITMEYVDGPTLAALSLQQPQRVLQWDYLRPMVEQLCAALEYAHSENVIHRDLKPANVMINSRGRLKLADFGIAAVASDSKSRASAKHSTSGTLSYMSPQQLAGRRPQATDDIYALGVTLYELLTSKPPFYGGDLTHQILHEAPEPIDERLVGLQIQNEIPPNISALIMDSLAKEPGQRPQSVSELRSRLQPPVEVEEAIMEEPAAEPLAPVVDLAAEPKARKSRKKAMVFAMIGIILCGLAAGWYWKVQSQAMRVAEAKRQAAEAESTRSAAEKQKAAEVEAARQTELARQTEAARLADVNRKMQLEKQAEETKRILAGNDAAALKALAGQGNADAAVKLGHFYHTAKGVPQEYVEAVKWYRKAGEAGNSEGQLWLGYMYENGLGVDKDYTEAVKWYRKAADAGNPGGEVQIGHFYRAGSIVARDYSEAVKWYRKATDAGYPDGQAWLGYMYENGLGVEKDYTEAVKWYRRAADAGNSEGQLRLGGMYNNGLGVEKDYAEAVKWYRKAADAGISAAQYDVGLAYENGLGVLKDSAAAIEWYGKAAKAGDLTAQQNLARMLAEEKRQAAEAEAARLDAATKQAALAERQKILDGNDPEALRVLAVRGDTDAAVNRGLIFQYGKGVIQDYVEARKWYVQAAYAGNARGQTSLGLMYKFGIGTETNYSEAFTWFQKAAEQGYPQGQVLLGTMFQNGLGVKQDNTQAVRQYRKAAEQGNAEGEDHLGYMYLYGYGVERDYGEAVNWFSRAAAAGNSSGQNNLGWMYEHELGVKQNYTEAVAWYRKAAEAGNSQAQANLMRLQNH